MRLEVDSGLQIWWTTEGEQQCEAFSAALVAPTPGQLTANASIGQDESHGLAHVNVSHLIIPTIGLFPVM